MSGIEKKPHMVTADDALAGRPYAIETAAEHAVFNRPLNLALPEGMEAAMVGMGCFWGAERLLWQLDGVYLTMVGYSAGFTPNPTYEETCTGMTGHNEVVRIVFDPAKLGYDALLQHFWDNHDPTQGMGQGNDVGTQYRSGIYTMNDGQRELAEASKIRFGTELRAAGFGDITTEIRPAEAFYFAEGYHQQYLHKNPDGYCGLGGTGVVCPLPLKGQ